MLSSASIVLFLALTIYGQANFEDYFFESLEDSSTSVPTEVEITFSSTTTTVPASSTFSSSTTNVPTSSTFLPVTSTTSESTTTTSTSTLLTTTTTTSLQKSQACNCDCEFFLEEIARRLKKFEKKMENNYQTQTTSSTTTTTPTTTTDKMDRFLEDVFSDFDGKTTTTPTTTTPTTTTDRMDRFLEDVFSEFDENFDAIPKRRSGGRSRTINEDWEQLLAITLSMAAAGITVLLMVCLFLCLQAKNGQDKAPPVEAATIEEDESPRIPLAEPEDIPYADEECEEVELRPI